MKHSAAKGHENHASKAPGLDGRFRACCQAAAGFAGSSVAFTTSCLIIFLWVVSGPLFHFSDTWQLVINTATTIITFLMVFLIQNTQNRDTKAIQLKLDELIRAIKGARNQLVSLESMTDEDLEALEKEFQRLRKTANARVNQNPAPAAVS